MAAGSIQQVVVCVPAEVAQAPCPAGHAMGVVSAYVLDPSAQGAFEASVAPFDYTVAGSIWALAFTFVLGLYLVAKSAGTVLSTIRR